MATSTSLRVLASLLLLASTASLGACGSTVTGGDDGADDDGASDDGSSSDDGSDDGSDGDDDDGGGCADEFVGDCIDGTAVCIDGSWICETPAECPATPPEGGASCTGDLSCSYQEDVPCGELETVTYECIDGHWMMPVLDRCSPVECPAEEPTVGTACDMWGAYCEYESQMDCGPAYIAYTCDEGIWAYASEAVPRCALPDCRDLSDAGSCAEFGCRWLEPGCGDNPLPAAGCFAADPCQVDGCFYADEVCTTVSIDPCAGAECDACAQEEALCIPTTGQE